MARKDGLPSKPNGFDMLLASLEMRWVKEFNDPDLSVGHGFGIESATDTNPPCWRIYVYSNNPEVHKKLPQKFNGIPVNPRFMATAGG